MPCIAAQKNSISNGLSLVTELAQQENSDQAVNMPAEVRSISVGGEGFAGMNLSVTLCL